MSILSYFGETTTTIEPIVSPWTHEVNPYTEELKFNIGEKRTFNVGDIVSTHYEIIKGNMGECAIDGCTNYSTVASVITSREIALQLFDSTCKDIMFAIEIYNLKMKDHASSYCYSKKQTDDVLVNIEIRTNLPESIDGLYFQIYVSHPKYGGVITGKTIVASQEISKLTKIIRDGNGNNYMTLNPDTVMSMFYHQEKKIKVLETAMKQLIQDMKLLENRLKQSEQSNKVMSHKLAKFTVPEIYAVSSEVLDIPIAKAKVVSFTEM